MLFLIMSVFITNANELFMFNDLNFINLIN